MTWLWLVGHRMHTKSHIYIYIYIYIYLSRYRCCFGFFVIVLALRLVLTMALASPHLRSWVALGDELRSLPTKYNQWGRKRPEAKAYSGLPGEPGSKLVHVFGLDEFIGRVRALFDDPSGGDDFVTAKVAAKFGPHTDWYVNVRKGGTQFVTNVVTPLTATGSRSQGSASGTPSWRTVTMPSCIK